MKRCQGKKVKGQGHKVTRRSSTKTSNISCKRHSVVEIHLSHKSRLIFSVCSIDADSFMDVDLADVGTSHIRLDAVQVQAVVFTSTHHYSVDGHLLVVVWRQYALLLHGRHLRRCPRRWKYHRRRSALYLLRPVCPVLHAIREIGQITLLV